MGNICNSKTPDKESFSRIATFYNINGEILEAEQKMYASFRRVRGLGYMTVSEMLETMHENDLFDIFRAAPRQERPEQSKSKMCSLLFGHAQQFYSVQKMRR